MSREDDWQAWCDRFDKTHHGVLRLFHDRAIWRTIMAMLEANPAVPRGGFGEYWLGSCYTDSMFIGIRRESDAKGTGLRRALKQLEATPRMATRDWYMSQVRQRDHEGWDSWAVAELEAAFNLFAGPGDAFIDSALVSKDIAELESVVTRVNAYTSKAIAHRDADISRAVAAQPVTWAELDATLDAVGMMHRKYYRLRHPGESLGGITPLVSPGWVQMFSTAWMRPGFMLPDHFDFEPAGLYG
jgi:hypothetical protein